MLNTFATRIVTIGAAGAMVAATAGAAGAAPLSLAPKSVVAPATPLLDVRMQRVGRPAYYRYGSRFHHHRHYGGGFFPLGAALGVLGAGIAAATAGDPYDYGYDYGGYDYPSYSYGYDYPSYSYGYPYSYGYQNYAYSYPSYGYRHHYRSQQPVYSQQPAYSRQPAYAQQPAYYGTTGSTQYNPRLQGQTSATDNGVNYWRRRPYLGQ